MIDNVPNGWRVEKMVNLSKILDGDRGKNYPKQEDFSDNDYCLFLTTKNVSKKGFKFDNTQFISKDKDEILRKGRLERNDLVITTRGTVGNIAFFNQDVPFDIIRINSGMAIIRITEEDLSHSFVNKYFKSNIFYRYVSEIISGSAQPQITITKLKNLTIPIPPLPQQEKIVKVLDISSALIERQKELIANYDLFLKSKFIEMFGDPIKNSMGWKVEKLDSFTTLVSSGSTPKGGQSSYLDEGEIRFIRSQNVRMNKMAYNGISYISEEVYTKMKRSQVKFNDVLLNITGASIGRTAIYKDTTRANVNQHVCIIRLTEELNNEYLSFMIASDSFQNQIISNQSGATREALNYSQIKKFNVPYPPIELQDKFASIVEQIEHIKDKETKKLEHLERLHKSLMDKAFKGEIQ